MGEGELSIFIIVTNIFVLAFIVSTLYFIFQYRKRKISYLKERINIENRNRLDQIEVQKQTMQFIGREIHDSVAQKLILASIYSQNLQHENQKLMITEKITTINNIIKEALSELRDLSVTLSDDRLQDKSLIELLNNECKKTNEVANCFCKLEGNISMPMSVRTKSSLLRVIQEFIQNSLKHSLCNFINIQLIERQNGLSIIAKDDGKGFDISEINITGSGLGNMKRRIQSIGGEISIRSSNENGTTLNIFIQKNVLFQE